MKAVLKAAILISIVLTSGCVEIPAMQSLFTSKAVSGPIEDIEVSGEIPRFVKEGKEFDFEVSVKANNDIENLKLDVFDKCPIFQNMTKENWEVSEIKSDRPAKILSPNPKYKVQDTIPFEQKDCQVSFNVKYTTNFMKRQEITILPYSEYERMTDAELKEKAGSSASSENPLKVTFSTDEDIPFVFMDNDKILFYIDCKNEGKGIIDKLNAWETSIKIPSVLNVEGCDDYAVFKHCKSAGDEIYKGYGSESTFIIDDGTPKKYYSRNTCGLSIGEGYKLVGHTSEGFEIYYTDNCKECPTPREERFIIITDIENKKGCRYALDSNTICEGLVSTSLNLKKDLNFNNKKAKRSTCTLTTGTASTILTENIAMSGKYEYKIIGEVGPIEVKKR